MGENNIFASKSKEIELYPYDKQIGKVFDLIKKDLSDGDYGLAKEYDIAMVKEALSKASRLKNLKIFLSLGRLLNKKMDGGYQSRY